MAYRVIVVKAQTKETLARRIREALAEEKPSDVISVKTGVDFQFWWPWRRNYAYVVLR